MYLIDGYLIQIIFSTYPLLSLSENDDNFAKDWLKLFESGSKSDLIIYARDEKAVKAHSLVLFARCQKLLENVIVENGERQVISMPEVSKNVLTAFLKYL